MSVSLNARLLQRIEISPGMAVFRVVPDGWELGEFKPGQFAVLGLPGSARRCELAGWEDEGSLPDVLIKRAYSIASSSVAREYIEFYVALVPTGQLTPRLFALNPGDPLWLGPKFSGVFTLDQVPPDKHVVFVSTGTGLAPYMSMLRTHLVCGGPRRFCVLHGARHSWELGYRSELLMLRRMCTNFVYVATISRPKDEVLQWGGDCGHVQDLWRKKSLEEAWGFRPTPENTHIFLCGNPRMVDDMVQVLGQEGFMVHHERNPGQVHVERYW